MLLKRDFPFESFKLCCKITKTKTAAKSCFGDEEPVMVFEVEAGLIMFLKFKALFSRSQMLRNIMKLRTYKSEEIKIPLGFEFETVKFH